jgi:hypothetical protein
MIAEYLDILRTAQPTYVIQSTDNPILIKLAALHTRHAHGLPQRELLRYFIENSDKRRHNRGAQGVGPIAYVRFNLHDGRLASSIPSASATPTGAEP